MATRPDGARPDWGALLIGGPSGSGKSALSYALARRFEVPIVEVDDIVEALMAMTTAAERPELHYWSTHPEAARLPPGGILELHLNVANALEPAIAAVIDNHLGTDTPVVIEGDYLLPALAARYGDRRVRGGFVREPDVQRLVENFGGRERNEGEQIGRARVSALYGEWLAQEAERCGVPIIEARPWSSLEARFLAAIGGT